MQIGIIWHSNWHHPIVNQTTCCFSLLSSFLITLLIRTVTLGSIRSLFVRTFLQVQPKAYWCIIHIAQYPEAWIIILGLILKSTLLNKGMHFTVKSTRMTIVQENVLKSTNQLFTSWRKLISLLQLRSFACQWGYHTLDLN